MSPQRSNRAQLIEGTLRCLERLPPERITARVIAEESGANLASITYHFGSKDNLVTDAVIEGLDRWLVEVSTMLAETGAATRPATGADTGAATGAATGADTGVASGAATRAATGAATGVATDSRNRFRRAAEAIEASRQRHRGLARNFVGALAAGQHDTRVRALLAEGFRHSRPNVATVLGLGDDEAGQDAAGLVLSMFHGLLLQVLLDATLAIDGDRLDRALTRLAARLTP